MPPFFSWFEQASQPLAIVAILTAASFLWPHPRWQAFLIRTSAIALRTCALVAVFGALLAYVFEESYWIRFMAPVGGLTRPEILAGTIGLALVVIPLASFLEFTARLEVSSRRTQGLAQGLSQTGTLLAQWLEEARTPGVELTPARKAELRTALDTFRPGKPGAPKPPSQRKTLGELVRARNS